MAAFDSIVNVEEWISDHYLTTDETKGDSFGKRVAARVREWKAEEDAAESTWQSPVTRLVSTRQKLQRRLAELLSDSSASTVRDAEKTESARETAGQAKTNVAEANDLLRITFGYGKPTTLSADRLGYTIGYEGWRSFGGGAQAGTGTGGLTVIDAGEIESADDIQDLSPAFTVTIDEKDSDWPVPKLVTELFLADDQPEFIVVLGGAWAIVAQRESWPLGRYLAVNVGLAIERGDAKVCGELHRVANILARENLEPAADGTTWWLETIENSLQHAVQVSEELRGAVRESIEILGNDVLERHRRQDVDFDPDLGNELAKQSLRYLYRILFLLFAEASPELNILPVGTPEYDQGYGLARLRDMVLDPPAGSAREGTHLYESLAILFRVVDEGNDPLDPKGDDFDPNATVEGLTFRELSADLFQPEKTNLIDRVKVSNGALHRVLENLLLSPEKRGRDRGYISYATLGVTELGQVYEGLMSYTGFVAAEDLYEVAPHGNPSKGSWVVPEARTADLPATSFVMDLVEDAGGGTRSVQRLHKKGSFVFRQSSRDRERSASFYTPQVLTEFTVGQAIEELRESGRIGKAEDILGLRICEPAMGSGAFAVEAVRQLAELYLEMRQEELNEQVPGEEYTRELQKVKAYLALHRVYGVDLNATAVELAEISLWLDTMTPELKAPWFGLHLRQGNSLIGASRATYAQSQLENRSWLKAVPRREPIAELADDSWSAPELPKRSSSKAAKSDFRIHHFLVPGEKWGAAADAKDAKQIAGEYQKQLKAWRNAMSRKFSESQLTQLRELSVRVDELWRRALIRMSISEDQIRRRVGIWGYDEEPINRVVKRRAIEEELLGNPDGAYGRLRIALDAWCAMWFWPLSETARTVSGQVIEAPDRDEWLASLKDLLGVPGQLASLNPKDADSYTMADVDTWEGLNAADDHDRVYARALSVAECLEKHPWLAVTKRVAEQQAFFHWDLDFSPVFAAGGFDLQVGNPPWVRPRGDVDSLLAETDPWFVLAHKPTQAEKRLRRDDLLQDPGAEEILLDGVGEVVGVAAVLGNPSLYPHLVGQQPDLYRGFIERTWANMDEQGVVSLIHPESHFTEKKAALLRYGAYLRLRRHWQFINELSLFDVHNLVQYGVHVYSQKREQVSFVMAASLYHPQTVTDSLRHDGQGALPGLKNDVGDWDLRPHRDRIVTVDDSVLATWYSVLEDSETPLYETRMVYTVNSASADVLAKLAAAPRVRELGLEFSRGWDESIDRKKGYFDVGWGHPKSWNDVILQGPHLGVSTPMIKQPNPTMKSNKDWSEIDLEAMPADFIPATAYQPNRAENQNYDVDYGTWPANGGQIPVLSTYRVAWRRMAATTGFRTFYPALIPPGSHHVHPVISAASANSSSATAKFGAFGSSLLTDLFLRSTGGGDLFGSVVNSVPFVESGSCLDAATREYLRLNCLTHAYAPLWEQCVGEEWVPSVPLRVPKARQEAQVRIDAAVALSLGVTVDELCMIYRTQFPVMRKYDMEDRYDANGRKVPKEILKLDAKLKGDAQLSVADRTWTHPQSGVEYVFEYPFERFDREAEYRKAYAELKKEVAE